MSTTALINFLNSLESKGILSKKANDKIQDYLDVNFNSIGKVFLVASAMIGALFGAAAIFAIISHNWDDFPKHLRGFLSLVPLLVGLYFYYLAVFKHKNSIVWAEASSLFLFLMIGASIALVAQTYQLDGDFNKFVKVWLGLSIPLFYVTRASGISLFYLGLACYFLVPVIKTGFLGIPSGYEYADNWWWFWIFFLAFLPHLLLNLNLKSKKQGIRGIYLGWVVAFIFYVGMPLIFQGGYIFWALTIVAGYQFIGHKLYSENHTILAKPFQFVSYFALFFTLLGISDKYVLRQIFRMENLENFGDYDTNQKLFFVLGLLCMIGTVICLKLFTDKKSSLINLIFILPGIIIFAMILHYIDQIWAKDFYWIAWFIINAFILALGIAAMIHGYKKKDYAPMFYGLFLIAALLWIRYFDTDITFWLKGIIFFGVAGFFFFINYVISEDVQTFFTNDSSSQLSQVTELLDGDSEEETTEDKPKEDPDEDSDEIV